MKHRLLRILALLLVLALLLPLSPLPVRAEEGDDDGGRTAYEVALEAYAQHVSQQIWTFTVYSFDSPLDSHRFGLVRSTVGPDELHNDLMEHLGDIELEDIHVE